MTEVEELLLDWLYSFLTVGEKDSRFGLQKAEGSAQTVQAGDIRVDVLFSQKGSESRAQSASRPFSEVLDLLGAALPDQTSKVEADNQPLGQGMKGIGTPRLTRGDKLHHKFAVIDNKTLITGSFHWSPSAAHTNEETLLAINSP